MKGRKRVNERNKVDMRAYSVWVRVCIPGSRANSLDTGHVPLVFAESCQKSGHPGNQEKKVEKFI